MQFTVRSQTPRRTRFADPETLEENTQESMYSGWMVSWDGQAQHVSHDGPLIKYHETFSNVENEINHIISYHIISVYLMSCMGYIFIFSLLLSEIVHLYLISCLPLGPVCRLFGFPVLVKSRWSRAKAVQEHRKCPSVHPFEMTRNRKRGFA